MTQRSLEDLIADYVAACDRVKQAILDAKAKATDQELEIDRTVLLQLMRQQRLLGLEVAKADAEVDNARQEYEDALERTVELQKEKTHWLDLIDKIGPIGSGDGTAGDPVEMMGRLALEKSSRISLREEADRLEKEKLKLKIDTEAQQKELSAIKEKVDRVVEATKPLWEDPSSKAIQCTPEETAMSPLAHQLPGPLFAIYTNAHFHALSGDNSLSVQIRQRQTHIEQPTKPMAPTCDPLEVVLDFAAGEANIVFRYVDYLSLVYVEANPEGTLDGFVPGDDGTMVDLTACYKLDSMRPEHAAALNVLGKTYSWAQTMAGIKTYKPLARRHQDQLADQPTVVKLISFIQSQQSNKMQE
eukprot:comp17554_c0_seq1/m.17147 comp17554_c0_seq1/g.17147  ORF comp17554_c0_seq1/g.17147 comp17554_c0_seq1/m.17147 type:complete len:358 (-) comp17554_c0_seq1:442-1515(-)